MIETETPVLEPACHQTINLVDRLKWTHLHLHGGASPSDAIKARDAAAGFKGPEGDHAWWNDATAAAWGMDQGGMEWDVSPDTNFVPPAGWPESESGEAGPSDPEAVLNEMVAQLSPAERADVEGVAAELMRGWSAAEAAKSARTEQGSCSMASSTAPGHQPSQQEQEQEQQEQQK